MVRSADEQVGSAGPGPGEFETGSRTLAEREEPGFSGGSGAAGFLRGGVDPSSMRVRARMLLVGWPRAFEVANLGRPLGEKEALLHDLRPRAAPARLAGVVTGPKRLRQGRSSSGLCAGYSATEGTRRRRRRHHARRFGYLRPRAARLSAKGLVRARRQKKPRSLRTASTTVAREAEGRADGTRKGAKSIAAMLASVGRTALWDVHGQCQARRAYSARD